MEKQSLKEVKVIDKYDKRALDELERWKREMRKSPSIINRASKGVQTKFNSILPDKYHEIVTFAISNMVKVVLTGSKYVTKKTYPVMSLRDKEKLVREKLKLYRNTAMVEGIGTGAGGILMSFADFPLLLTIKIKFLYDIAAIYGYDITDYKERLYILNIFQLAFSSQSKMNNVFYNMENWTDYSRDLPEEMDPEAWRDFQQEYRDYLDIAKLLQMIPGVGAVVGGYTNSKLLNKLGVTAMNAYRMRLTQDIESV